MSAPLFGYTPFIYNNHKKKQCPISRHKNKTISPRTKFSTSFSPNTKLKLRDGRVIAIKDLTLGDVLEDGEIVNVILKVRNVDRVPFYRIFNSQLNEYIYVTGCHYILEMGKFIRVRDSQLSEKTEVVEDMFVCLITSTHRIPIGEHTFWDWSDFCESCNEGEIAQEFFLRDRFNEL